MEGLIYPSPTSDIKFTKITVNHTRQAAGNVFVDVGLSVPLLYYQFITEGDEDIREPDGNRSTMNFYGFDLNQINLEILKLLEFEDMLKGFNNEKNQPHDG